MTMQDDPKKQEDPTKQDGSATPRVLAPAAERALAEAALRRSEIDARAAEIAATRERQGRGGLEPVRYADWEIKGIAVDF